MNKLYCLKYKNLVDLIPKNNNKSDVEGKSFGESVLTNFLNSDYDIKISNLIYVSKKR